MGYFRETKKNLYFLSSVRNTKKSGGLNFYLEDLEDEGRLGGLMGDLKSESAPQQSFVLIRILIPTVISLAHRIS